jgi:hypothetical protein
VKYQNYSDIEGGDNQLIGDTDEGNSFTLKVSRIPDDLEALRFVVSVLPGVEGRPVKGKLIIINKAAI